MYRTCCYTSLQVYRTGVKYRTGSHRVPGPVETNGRVPHGAVSPHDRRLLLVLVEHELPLGLGLVLGLQVDQQLLPVQQLGVGLAGLRELLRVPVPLVGHHVDRHHAAVHLMIMMMTMMIMINDDPDNDDVHLDLVGVDVDGVLAPRVREVLVNVADEGDVLRTIQYSVSVQNRLSHYSTGVQN